MTEDEARTKWCPFSRVVTVHSDAGMIAGPGNRTEICGQSQFTKPMASLCIGSACMAWRLAEIKYRHESAGPQGGYKKVAISDGYCGLAGKPA